MLIACAYFSCSFFLTSSTKDIFSVRRFPHPLLISLLHMCATHVAVSCYLLLTGSPLQRPPRAQLKQLLLYSAIFTTNILFSNLALSYLDLTLHQTLSSCTPVVTMVQSYYLLNTVFPPRQVAYIFGISLGAVMCVGGTFNPHLLGIALSLVGVVVSSSKSVFTKLLLSNNTNDAGAEKLPELSPFALSYWLTFFSAIQLSFFVFFHTDAHAEILDAFGDPHFLYALAWNMLAAAGVNITNPMLISATSPLVVNILGISKNVSLTFLDLLSTPDHFTLLKAIGVIITFISLTLFRFF